MNDLDLERVLKSAGLREKPPADVERAVRERLHGQWRETVAERAQRTRRRASFALAAGIAAAAFAVWALLPRFAAAPAVVATVAVASGELRVTSGWADRWHDAAPGRALLAGQTLETGPTGRGAIALAGGVSARLDRGSRVVVAAPGRLELERGTLYVDSGNPGSPAAALDVVTHTGTIRHVGTQYEVRLLDAGVQVSVRDGLVEWRSRSGNVARSGSGQRLTISRDGRIERATVPAYGEDWSWTLEAAPPIDIEGLPLSRFLAWAARETGRSVVYATADAERDAAGIVVHGSIAGLTPTEALDAVLATTSVEATASGDRLVVSPR